MKKQIQYLLVPLYLTSCTTTQVSNTNSGIEQKVSSESGVPQLDLEFLKLSSCAEENAQRAPSSQTSCQKYYEADKAITELTKQQIREGILSEMSGKTRILEQFGQTENLGFWAMYLGSASVKEILKSDMHPVEFMRDKDVKSFSRAWRTLRDISDSKFSLSSDLAMDINKLLQGDAETTVIQEMNSRLTFEQADKKKSALDSLKSSVQSYFSGSGYRTKAIKKDYSFDQISEADFAAIKENIKSVGGRVEETNFSAEKSRSFVVYAPIGEALQTQLNGVLRSANISMATMKNASFNDKIDFVADLHLKLTAISPFSKLNELTVQMLINRVLIQVGLDPAVRVPVDLSMSKSQVAELYKNGIVDYITYTQKTYDVKSDKKSDSSEIYAEKEAVAITGRGAGLRVKIYGKYAKAYPKAVSLMRTKDRVTPIDGRMIQLGVDRRNFVLKDDGFLYDGVTPYTVRVEGNQYKLYPISDYAYRLLGLNGELTGEIGVRRAVTEEHQELLRSNLISIENLLEGKLRAEDFQIIYDKNVIDANRTGSLFVYDWQLPSLERAAKIKEDPKEDPYGALVPSRGDPIEIRKAGRSSFEQNYFKGSRGNKIGDLIGQYEQRDLDYNKLAREVKKSTVLSQNKKEQLLSDILESRRKLHIAAREILTPFLRQVSSLNSKELAVLRDNANFYQVEDFLNNFSKLKYESLDKAIEAMGDDHVFVQRVQAKWKTFFIGHISQVEQKSHPLVVLATLNGLLLPQYREFYNLMNNPKEQAELQNTGKLSQRINAKVAQLAKGNDFAKKIINEILLSYSIRAKDIQSVEEFESFFMNHYLHAVNRGSKIGISTTSDPTYLLTLKSFEQLSKLGPDPVLVSLFKEYVKSSETPEIQAKQWLIEMALKEQKKQLAVEYYELSWIGAFAKHFNVPKKTVVNFVKEANKKANNDKFTTLEAPIFVLRVPVDNIDPNYASGYAGQFENTTSIGFGTIKSHLQLIKRAYSGSEKYGVNLAGLNEKTRAVYDMLNTHLEPQADFTPYLTYSSNSSKHVKVLGDLFDQNQKVYNQAIRDLKGLKYDLQTIKGKEAIEGFKALVEDVFNTSLKVVEYQKEKEVRKTILDSLKLFLQNHASQRGGEEVAGWVLEMWESVATSQGKYSKDIVSKAKSEVNVYKRRLGIEVPKVADKKSKTEEAAAQTQEPAA